MARALVLLGFLVLDAAACGSPSAGDGGPGTDSGPDPAWWEPDPEGRTSRGDLRGSPAEMVIVTSPALVPVFRSYAARRELTGLRTDVVALEDALAGREGRDQAERLRAYLRSAHEAGARFALLGGDAEVVPFRRVADHVSITFVGQYDTNGPAEVYFSELEADWDPDGDGVYGEEEEIRVEDLREPELHVGRLPVSSQPEVEAYARKLERFETETAGREASVLVMSDVASTIPGVGDIDAALALEVTIDGVFPEALARGARRLYATEAAALEYGGELISAELVREAFAEGHSLAFHNGHGAHGWLTSVMSSRLVDQLDCGLPPVMLSCACLAGNFADRAESSEPGEWQAQGPDDDSAAERFIVSWGGGLVYLGSTGTGLGPAGGSQILHATLEGLFVAGLPTIGEALAYGRAHMREVELRLMGLVMPVTDDSERWTQLVTVLLGDPSVRPWTGPARALELSAPDDYGPGYQELTVVVREAGTGAPVVGATVVLRKEGDFLLRELTGESGEATFGFVPRGPAELAVSATAPGALRVGRSLRPRS